MPDFSLRPENPVDAPQIEPLLDRTFGPSRTGRTVYRLRENLPALPQLSFVAVNDDDSMIASLRFWPILIGRTRHPAVLLGPLAVEPALQGRGIGKALVRHGLTAAKRLGYKVCVVVGEPEYYAPFGFKSAPAAGLLLPGPVDPRRFQVLELTPGALENIKGMIGRDERPKMPRAGLRALIAGGINSARRLSR